MSAKYKIINTTYIDEISSDLEFKKKILSLFKQNVQEYEIKMAEALNQNKLDELAELAHKAKSTVKILGMDKQGDEMKRLELDIKEKIKIDSYEKRISDFIFFCHSALKEIDMLEKELF